MATQDGATVSSGSRGAGGGAPSGPASGDLGSTYPAPTVVNLTIASQARGDLLRRGATAWERVSANTAGNVVSGDGTDVVSVTIATVLAVAASANRSALGLGLLATASSITASQISDGTAAGRTLLTAADAAAQRTALGLGTLATASSITASQISDGTAAGRTLLTAANAAAQRSAIGVDLLRWMGAWDVATAYVAGDGVTSAGSTWRALRSVTGGSAPSEGADWNVFASKGAKGDTGNTGAKGDTGPAGPSGDALAWQGAWSSGVSYSTGDTVTSGGSTWRAKQPVSSGGSAPAEGADWAVVASKGDTGATGAAGAGGVPPRLLAGFTDANHFTRSTTVSADAVGGVGYSWLLCGFLSSSTASLRKVWEYQGSGNGWGIIVEGTAVKVYLAGVNGGAGSSTPFSIGLTLTANAAFAVVIEYVSGQIRATLNGGAVAVTSLTGTYAPATSASLMSIGGDRNNAAGYAFSEGKIAECDMLSGAIGDTTIRSLASTASTTYSFASQFSTAQRAALRFSWCACDGGTLLRSGIGPLTAAGTLTASQPT